jgi:hypothetical protein
VSNANYISGISKPLNSHRLIEQKSQIPKGMTRVKSFNNLNSHKSHGHQVGYIIQEKPQERVLIAGKLSHREK